MKNKKPESEKLNKAEKKEKRMLEKAEKQAEKKAKKESKKLQKVSSPAKDYRVFFRRLIWFVFIAMVCGSIISIVRTVRFSEKLENVTGELMSEVNAFFNEQEVRESIVNEEGAKLFALDFMKEYYTWGNGEERVKERSERLSPYLEAALDKQAGFAIDEITCKSDVISIKVWRIEEMASNACKVTVVVSYTLKDQVQEESIIEKTNEAGEIYQETGIETKEEIKGTYEKYVVVPLQTDGQNFIVSGIPIIASAPTEVVIVSTEETEKENQTFDTAITTEVNAFCQTFLKVLTSGTQEELDYYTDTNVKIKTLAAVYAFDSFMDVSIYEVSDGIKVTGTIVFKEVSTSAKVNVPVELYLEKQSERYLVKSFDY